MCSVPMMVLNTDGFISNISFDVKLSLPRRFV